MSQSIDPSGEVTMDDRDDGELEAKMEEFLRLQAERESGMHPSPCVLIASKSVVALQRQF